MVARRPNPPHPLPLSPSQDALVQVAADNTQVILDLLDVTKQSLIDKEDEESKATRAKLTTEVRAGRVLVIP
mgnify:CR=1 FL=1